MNKTLWWILAASVFVGLIIMITSVLVTRYKIKKIQEKYKINNSGGIKNKAFNRGEDHGQLLWELKEKTKKPLFNESMEFAINTCLRNNYKAFSTINFQEEYEKETLIQKAKLKEDEYKYDFCLINFYEKLIDKIDFIFKKLNEKGMLMIVNAEKKESKELIQYLKYTGIRSEYQKINLGIILIAK